MIELQHLECIDSTNAYLRRERPEQNLAVTATYQTAGRGQRGNKWHAPVAENLLMSILWHPISLPVNLQFALSEATALGVVNALAETGVCATIKWPNDIYINDKKICGILIENSVSSRLESSIIGIGINLNQTSFPVDLPNPISIKLLTGSHTDTKVFARMVTDRIEQNLLLADSDCGRQRLHSLFLSNLYRYDHHQHPFRNPATGRCFNAKIADVEPTGFLILDHDGDSHRYAFKEVEFII